jgi:medium-chain acyl-[acyl-carrier-protein] hydrolase
MDLQEKKINSPSPIWEEEFSIYAKDIDFNGKLKFYCICGYFFEIAARHANHLRFGFQDLKQENVYWVLSRLHIKILKYPGFEQKINIQTWHKGVGRLFGLRDFRILDKNGQELALATSAWLILDKKNGRPVRPEKFTELYNSKMDYYAINELPDKLQPLSEYDQSKLIDPGYTDLDINVHVNAGKYIAWIQDLYPPDFYSKFLIAEFQINYLNETRYGQKIRILSRQESTESQLSSRIEGRIDGTDNPAFRAHIIWNKTDK